MNATLLLVAAAVLAQERIALDGPWQIAPAAADGRHPATYERTVVVPSAFETALGTEFDGVAWYRRALPIGAKERDERVRI